MDILSEVLRVVRLSGAIHFWGEFRAPWSFMTAPPDMVTARLKVPAGSVTPFHVFVDGNCWIRTGDHPPIKVGSGDIIVFPHAHQHVMASDLHLEPVPFASIYAPAEQQLTVLRHGGGGEIARFICGYLHADQQFDPLLSSLPAALCVRADGEALALDSMSKSEWQSQPIEQRQEVEWWRASVGYLVSEAGMPGPGNRAVLARLAESLFVQVLRWQLRYSASASGGWLAGLHDPQVSRVLRLLHALPDRGWTVDELAKEAGMSRAALAKRFVTLVGQSPIQYLAEWRMHLARQLLRESGLGVGEIAGRVGYESEAAFNRAFHRLVGTPPATWRQAEGATSQLEAAR